MSTNRQPRTGVENRSDQRTQHQMGATVERQVTPEDRGIAAPGFPEVERSPSLTALMGPPPSEDDVPPGKGPRIVILDGFVNGPGSLRGHSRGDVIWLSELLGLDMMEDEKKQREAQAQLRYYMERGAIREATTEERNQVKVTFLEGEDQYADALTAKAVENSNLRDENASLKAQIAMLQEGKSPQEVAQATRNRANTPQVVSQPQGEAVGDNAIL